MIQNAWSTIERQRRDITLRPFPWLNFLILVEQIQYYRMIAFVLAVVSHDQYIPPLNLRARFYREQAHPGGYT